MNLVDKRKRAAIRAFEAHDVKKNGTKVQRARLAEALYPNDVVEVEGNAALVDLLADSMHLAAEKKNLDFDRALEVAKAHFKEESSPESWMDRGKLYAVRIGEQQHIRLSNEGYRTHHVDGRIAYLEKGEKV
jgi:hypothetical protein